MEKMRLENLECFISDGNYSSKYPRNDEFLDEGVPFIRCNNFKNNTIIKKEMYYISKEKHATLLKGHVKEGDILITTRGSLGEVAIVPKEYENANINAQIVLLRVNSEKIYNRYLMWELKSPNVQNQIIRNKTGTTLQQLPINRLKGIEISLEKDIQKQISIANKLDKIQEIIDTRKMQIEELDKLIKSQFVEMFQSGSYPKEELGKLCDVRDGTHDSPKYLEESGYKFITSKNIINSEIDFSEVKYISKQDYDRFNTRSKVNYGDILMPMIGTIGKPIIINIPDDEIDFAIKNVALIKFLDNSQVTNIYIKNLFDSDYFENAILQNKRGGTQKFIALSDIRKMQIEIPPIELQEQFEQKFQQIDKQKFKLQKSLEEMEILQESLMDKYFGE